MISILPTLPLVRSTQVSMLLHGRKIRNACICFITHFSGTLEYQKALRGCWLPAGTSLQTQGLSGSTTGTSTQTRWASTLRA